MKDRLKRFFKDLCNIPFGLENFPHSYPLSLVEARAEETSRIIYETRQLSRKGPVTWIEARRLGMMSTLAEIAIVRLLREQGYDAAWAAEHESLKLPYDVIISDGDERFYIDVKCGEPDTTITLTLSEHDKIIGDELAGIIADPKLKDTHHVRADWTGSTIVIKSFYPVRGQSWQPGKQNDELLEKGFGWKRSYFLGQDYVRT